MLQGCSTYRRSEGRGRVKRRTESNNALGQVYDWAGACGAEGKVIYDNDPSAHNLMRRE